MRQLNKRVNHEHVSAEDYTIYVKGLPTDATVEEVRDHFSKLYHLDAPDWEFRGACGCIGRKPFRLSGENMA